MDGYGARVASARSGWLAGRDTIARTPEGRLFVDHILSDLAAGGFRPAAWSSFWARSIARSAAQARLRPFAVAEATVMHLIAGAVGSRRWAAASWLLCVTHLGLLGDSATLGWANRLTLLRGLLPGLAPDSRASALVALGTDFLDGTMARRSRESAFGAFADPIADGIFWSWYALRWEKNRWLRWAPAAVFATTVGAIAGEYFAKSRTIDYPRLSAGRFVSAAAQVALTVRAMRPVSD